MFLKNCVIKGEVQSFFLYELALNATSRSRAPLGRNFRTFGEGLFSAVLQPFRGKQKNNAVLETIALGIIALDSDNEAWYGNAEYDDARETFGIDENAHELEFVCIIEKSTIYKMAQKMRAEKLHALKLRHNMN